MAVEPRRAGAVDARAARTVLLEELPEVVRRSLVPGGVDVDCARLHVETVEDADHLAAAPGARARRLRGRRIDLPRESGASDRPLREGAVPFESPEELRVPVELPNRGEIAGMGIPEGVTLVAGGLPREEHAALALSWGVYDHVAGDGREMWWRGPTRSRSEPRTVAA